MEPLSVEEQEPARQPMPDSLVAVVAHTATVPDTVGEAVAVEHREEVVNTLPISDGAAWAKMARLQVVREVIVRWYLSKTGAAAGRFECSR